MVDLSLNETASQQGVLDISRNDETTQKENEIFPMILDTYPAIEEATLFADESNHELLAILKIGDQKRSEF